MAHLFTAITSYKLFEQGGAAIEDDLIDKLNYQLTTGFLIVFSIGVCFKQFAGQPIECALSNVAEGSDER